MSASDSFAPSSCWGGMSSNRPLPLTLPGKTAPQADIAPVSQERTKLGSAGSGPLGNLPPPKLPESSHRKRLPRAGMTRSVRCRRHGQALATPESPDSPAPWKILFRSCHASQRVALFAPRPGCGASARGLSFHHGPQAGHRSPLNQRRCIDLMRCRRRNLNVSLLRRRRSSKRCVSW